MMWNCGGLGFWGTGYGWLDLLLNLVITLVAIIGIVLLIAWLVRRILPAREITGRRPGSLLTAKEVLQARYARGDLNRKQYKKMLSELAEE